MVICLERGANDLHVVQLMPLPPTSLATVKSRMVYLSGVLEKRPLNRCNVVVFLLEVLPSVL